MHIMDCLTGKDCIVSCARVSTQCTEALRLTLYVLYELLTRTFRQLLHIEGNHAELLKHSPSQNMAVT